MINDDKGEDKDWAYMKSQTTKKHTKSEHNVQLRACEHPTQHLYKIVPRRAGEIWVIGSSATFVTPPKFEEENKDIVNPIRRIYIGL